MLRLRLVLVYARVQMALYVVVVGFVLARKWFPPPHAPCRPAGAFLVLACWRMLTDFPVYGTAWAFPPPGFATNLREFICGVLKSPDGLAARRPMPGGFFFLSLSFITAAPAR